MGNETSLGGPFRSFPSTIWSDILAAGSPDDTRHREKLEGLIQQYWKPVYAYIRVAWHKSVEDAKDLTQAFFARILEKGYLAHLRPERGSFRGYLRTALRHFLINVREGEEVRKPVTPVCSLNAEPGELERIGPAAPDETPERAYDREWFQTLIEAGIRDLKERLGREGKLVYYQTFKMYCIDPQLPADRSRGSTIFLPESPSSPTHRDIAQILGITKIDVMNHLVYARKLFQEILRDRIRDYVSADEDVEGELGEFLAR